MAEVYGITGFFKQYRNFYPFGGFFILNPDGVLLGNLVDSRGTSSIGGRMQRDLFEFRKLYAGRDHSVGYSFKKNDKGIWVGRYDGVSTGSDIALCKLTQDWTGLEFEDRQRVTLEEEVEISIDHMIERGTLRPVEGPKAR